MSWRFHQLGENELKLGQLVKDINQLIVKYTQAKGSEADANLVFGVVWLGNSTVAHDFNFFTSKRIKYVVNVSYSVPNQFPFFW